MTTPQNHSVSPLAHYLKEIVYGGIDGIVTTFAVVAGFSGAHYSGSMTAIPLMSVLLFGFANLFADATSMGLGNFLSVRATQDMYLKMKKKEQSEVEAMSNQEGTETIRLLEMKGFTHDQALQLTTIMIQNEDFWVEFLMKNELAISSPQIERPALTALATFVSFIFFGAIPLLPYVLSPESNGSLFSLSIVFTVSSLLLLGFVRWKITEQHIFRSVFETLLVGMLSALVAYTVGTFFHV